MNKVIISGHTSGIGKTLYDYYSPNALGISRSTGFDITKDKFTYHGDMFINNAINFESYEGMFGQIRIFWQAWKLWRKNPNRVIVNIGSISTDYPFSPTYPQMMYASAKAALENASRSCQYIENGPRVIHVKLGAVNTPLVEKFKIPKIDTKQVINGMLAALNNPYCYEIKISTRGFNNV